MGGGIGGMFEDMTGIDIGATSSTDRALSAQRNAANAANSTQMYIFDQQRQDQRPWQQAGGMALGDLMYGLGYNMPQQHQFSDKESARLAELERLSGQANFGQTGDSWISRLRAQSRGQQYAKELEGLRERKQAYDLEKQQMATRQQHMDLGSFNKEFTMDDFKKDPGYDFRMGEGMKALERSAAARGGLNSGATLKAITQYGQDFAANEYQNSYNRFNADRDRRFNRLASMTGMGQTANSQVGQAGQNYANQYGQNVMGAANAQAAAAMGRSNQMMGMLGLGLGAYGGAAGWYKG